MADNPVPVRPTAEILRQAEIEAGEAAHALTMADPECVRFDVLRTQATAARALVLRLRAAALSTELAAVIPTAVAMLALPGVF